VAVKDAPGRNLLIGSSWELDPSEVALSLGRPEWENVVRTHAVPPPAEPCSPSAPIGQSELFA